MLEHPAELIIEVHKEDFLPERIEMQAAFIKQLLFDNGACDVGRGVTDIYTLQDVLEDQQDKYLFKGLAALWRAKDSDLNSRQAANKLINYLDSMVEDAATLQGKAPSKDGLMVTFNQSVKQAAQGDNLALKLHALLEAFNKKQTAIDQAENSVDCMISNAVFIASCDVSINEIDQLLNQSANELIGSKKLLLAS
jgi:hypothetical protein